MLHVELQEKCQIVGALTCAGKADQQSYPCRAKMLASPAAEVLLLSEWLMQVLQITAGFWSLQTLGHCWLVVGCEKNAIQTCACALTGAHL